MARASVASSSNSAGVQKRSIGACLGVGCRYWPMVRKSTSAARRSSITCRISSRVSPRPTIRPDLVNIDGIDLLHLRQQPQRGEVARAGPDRRIEPRHGLEIVVEDVGPRRDHGLDGAVLAQEVGRQHLDRRVGRLLVQRRDHRGEVPCPAVRQVVAVDRGDDDMAEARACRRLRRCWPARADRARRGLPVATLQKAQARVQVSPRIMKVACFCFQHSPMFGQAASSHTVCEAVLAHQRAWSRHIPASSAHAPGSSPACAGSDCPAGAPSRDGARRGSAGACRCESVHDGLDMERPAVGRQHRLVHHLRQGRDAGRPWPSARPRWSPASWRSL